ncbi:MAG: acyl-CoA thioesterase [Ramlibacter sp.]
MSGLLRNLLTLLVALFHRNRCTPADTVAAWFRVTPLDTGLLTLKSDQYLQFAEAAQIDFMVRSGLAGVTLRRRLRFVNLAQHVAFARPVHLLDAVRVDTRVLHADGKCVYFSHGFSVKGEHRAEVLVKMKFKQGRLTIPTESLLGPFTGTKPAQLQQWDALLGAGNAALNP